MMRARMKFWPIAAFVSFALVSPARRVLFNNLVGMTWVSLSWDLRIEFDANLGTRALFWVWCRWEDMHDVSNSWSGHATGHHSILLHTWSIVEDENILVDAEKSYLANTITKAGESDSWSLDRIYMYFRVRFEFSKSKIGM
jgi:hypothetical protein